MLRRKRIKIVYTGGTIGGELREGEQVVESDLKPKYFLDSLESLFPRARKSCELTGVTSPINKFSEDIVPCDWGKIAKSIYNAIEAEGAQGIVVAHGTDTLAYTASALSFMLPGLRVPVILTGSNLPLLHPDTDAKRNMADALLVAMDERFRGVFVVFSGDPTRPSTIHLGTRSRKKILARNAFSFGSVNTTSIGHVSPSGIFRQPGISFTNTDLLAEHQRLISAQRFAVQDKIDENVFFFQIHPGFRADCIVHVLKADTAGIILDLYNSGTGCTEKGKYNLIDAVQEAQAKQIPVFATSQHGGPVGMDVYGSSIELRKVGVTPLSNMIKEAAIPKLMWARAKFPDKEKQKHDLITLMTSNVISEIDQNN